MAAEKNRYQSSKYFGQVSDIFRDLPDQDSQRTYTSALLKCFDINEGKPDAPVQVCMDHGYSASKPKDLRFVLAKKHAIKFFVTDCSWPGVSASDIRGVSLKDYIERFDREPFTRGRSSYWLTMAEWIVVLDAPGSAPLPDLIQKFAAENNLV